MLNINKQSFKNTALGLLFIAFLAITLVPFTVKASCCNEPSVNTNSADNIDMDSATLNGYVDGNGSATKSWFEYGKTRSMTAETSHTSTGSGSRDFSKTISNLKEDTVYYFRAVAENNDGIDYGETFSFTTDTTYSNTNNNYYDNYYYDAVTNRRLDPRAISILTVGATSVASTSADLHALASNDSMYNVNAWFEWGRSQNLGYATSPASLGDYPNANHINTLTGLQPNTTYYFRAVIENSYTVKYGSIMSFTTGVNIVIPQTTKTIYVKEPVYIEKPTPAPTTTGTVEPTPKPSISSALGASAIGSSFLPQNIFGWLVLIILFLILLVLVKHLFTPSKPTESHGGHH